MPIKAPPIKEIKFAAIPKWNLPHAPERVHAPFKATPASTLALLRAELGFVKAKNAEIGLCCDHDQIRNDGYPKTGARTFDSGVTVSFTKGNTPLRFSCDKFKSWVDNVRAIALTLERLRKAELYGCVRSGEQYSGFAQLPGPDAGTKVVAFTTVEDAAAYIDILHKELYGLSGFSVRASLKDVWRACAKKLHPDNAVHGDAGKFRLLNDAWALVEAKGETHVC